MASAHLDCAVWPLDAHALPCFGGDSDCFDRTAAVRTVADLSLVRVFFIHCSARAVVVRHTQRSASVSCKCCEV